MQEWGREHRYRIHRINIDGQQTCQNYGFSSSHVWMWQLDYIESWAPKNWCFWTVVLDKILESPLDCKEIQPVHPKGSQSWIFIGRTEAEVKLQYFGHLMWRTGSLEKILMLAKIEAGGEGDDRGWDGWMASPTQWTWWVWVNSRSWWWTGRPGVPQSMGSPRVGHNWAIELNKESALSSKTDKQCEIHIFTCTKIHYLVYTNLWGFLNC